MLNVGGVYNLKGEYIVVMRIQGETVTYRYEEDSRNVPHTTSVHLFELLLSK
jgi:hypothetical protein